MIWYNNNYKENQSNQIQLPGDDNYYKEDQYWIQLPGALKQLDSDGTMICGANSANDFWCRKDTFSDWVLQ